MPYKDPIKQNEYLKEYMLRRYHARMDEARAMLGGVCIQCGLDDGDLDLDHIDPVTKSFAIGKMWSISKPKFLAELEKCQLLCQECHKTKTADERKASVA